LSVVRADANEMRRGGGGGGGLALERGQASAPQVLFNLLNIRFVFRSGILSNLHKSASRALEPDPARHIGHAALTWSRLA
jgi:hypothetical protein